MDGKAKNHRGNRRGPAWRCHRTVAALFGMECRVFMGTEDIQRQAANVQRMQLLGAEVVPVVTGTGTLKDAMSEAIRYWVGAVRDTFYVIVP